MIKADLNHDRAQRRQGLQAFGLALLIEAGLIGAVVIYGMTHVAPAPIKEGTIITLTPDPIEKPLPPKPKLKPTPPVPKPKVVEPKPPKVIKQKVEPVKLPDPPKPVVQKPVPTPVATPTASTEPAPPPPTPPAPPTPPKPDVSPAVAASYAGEIRAAVQVLVDAGHISAKGRAKIEVTLRDGHASGISMITSSGIPEVDKLALHAVTDANYPTPPAELKGIDKTYRFWVEVH